MKKRRKIYDCITFFKDNFITNIRFEILKNVIDHFFVCESTYDHQGNKKKINFNLKNLELKDKVTHVIFKSDSRKLDPWKRQALQRDYLIPELKNLDDNDLVMFSDPDEIPNPEILNQFYLKKKFGIFLQKCFSYKFNLINNYETPWEGTRICKKKDLKSIDYLREKIKTKNLKKSFWKFGVERNIEIIKNGGWHFSYLLTPQEISTKLKTFAHVEFSGEKFSNVLVIEKKIFNRIDLFERGHVYKKVELDNSFPNFLLNNKGNLKDWLI